jgi:hypothetical protein
MHILCVKHKEGDFVLTFECTKFQKRWDKGCHLLSENTLTSTYSASEDVDVVHIHPNVTDNEDILLSDPTQKAFFFEQTDYSVWIEFADDVTDAAFIGNRAEDCEHFSYKAHRKVLMGFLNYENEIGRADFPIAYTKGGERKTFTFSYDVLSTKLDYHHDWKIILQDIEQEYRMLSLDYLRKTYHGISEGDGESFDLIWWNIFHGLQEEFIRSCKNIIERPRHRLRAVSSYKRADQIRRFTTTLEQQFSEHKHEESHLYYVEEQHTTHNTIENRFLKHTLQMIQKRYSALAKRVLELNISDPEKERIKTTADTLQFLVRNPFFRTIGKFEGLKQESLILQRDFNYSKVYRTSAILRKSFNLNDGLYRMETKDIATLYEIWCFIQVEKVVKELFREQDIDVTTDHQNRMEMHSLFTYDLGKGEHSRIVFKNGDITLAELVYNPKHTEHVNDRMGIAHFESPTVPQKPDIVLQLTKDDLERGMNLTYLFDAKYRIEQDRKGRDVPPDDAINQMHRYRDAIYYSTPQNGLKKEVLGGYILFPGQMTETDHFRQSVDEVNIGAFPLRPGVKQHEMLRDFIAELMRKNAVEIVEQVIPQKGTTLEIRDKVLVGLVREDNLAKFIDRSASVYYAGKNYTFPQNIYLNNVHWFVPVLKGKGARDLYKINAVHTGKKPHEDEADAARIVFDIEYIRPLYDDYDTSLSSKVIHGVTCLTLKDLEQ